MLRWYDLFFFSFATMVVGFLPVLPLALFANLVVGYSEYLPDTSLGNLVRILAHLGSGAFALWIMFRYLIPLFKDVGDYRSTLLNTGEPIRPGESLALIGKRISRLWLDILWVKRRFHA